MNDLKALEQKHSNLLVSAKELGKEIERLKNEPVREMPGKDVEYHIVNDRGEIVACRNRHEAPAKKQFNNGNVFANESDAEKHAKRLKVFNLLWDYARIFNEGKKGNYHIIMNEYGSLTIVSVYAIATTPKFYSQNDAFKAIELIGKDIIKEAWS